MVNRHSLNTILVLLLIIFFRCTKASPMLLRERYDIHGNFKPDTENKKEIDSNCCYVPSCDHNGCYDLVKCGYQCSQAHYRPARYYPTPGFKVLDSYKAYQCYFSNCDYYTLTCEHCPDPTKPSFSIYTVRSDCRNCYVKNERQMSR